MATYGTDLILVTNAESGTWTEFTPYAVGGTPAADGENYIQGTNCYSQTTGTKTGLSFSVVFDNGTNITWTTGHVFLIWQFYAVGVNLETYANGGSRVGIGSSTSAINSYASGGRNFGRNPFGGWQNIAVDPQRTADYTDGGGNGGNYRYIGSIMYTLNAISKGTPHAVDAIRRGRAQLYCTGTGCEFTTMADYNDYNSLTAHPNSADTGGYNRFGLFQDIGGVYLWKGLMSLGITATSATFSDSNKTIVVEDAAKTYLGFNKIEVNNASTSVTWTNISFISTGTVSPGQFEMIANATMIMEGCLFVEMDTFIFQSNSTVTGTSFVGCKTITAGGGIFTGSKVLQSSVVADGYALSWNDASDPDGNLNDMTFTKGTNAHHAINFDTTSPTTMTLRGISFSGFNASNSQNDSTLYISRTTGTVTINLVGCSGNISYKSAGAIVVLVVDPVTLLVTVTDIDTGDPVSGARVIVEVADGTNFPYQDSISMTGTGTTVTVTHTAHGLSTNDYVVTLGATNDDSYNGVHQITVSDVDTYTFVADETITTSPATGTLTATLALISGTTDINGEISDSRSYASPQPIMGWVRKGSSAPYYKQQPITGTVSNTAGLSISALLIRDE
jgi:hypothetical protein